MVATFAGIVIDVSGVSLNANSSIRVRLAGSVICEMFVRKNA